MGFGPGAEGGILKDMTNIMKSVGGEYKKAITTSELI